jgi:hypothetical protein
MLNTAGWLAAGCLFVAMTAAPVAAQSRVRVNIPFAFQAGAESLPSGQYLIDRMSPTGPSLLRIHNVDANKSFGLMSLPATRPVTGDYPRLKFEILAGTYRLAEVWTPGAEGGVFLPRTREQAVIAKQEGKVRTIALALTAER